MVSPLRGRPWSAVVLAVLALGWSVACLPSAAHAAAPLPSEVPFQVPPGFVVERVAGPPLVVCPLYACFDDRGRLYVADSLGINLTTRADLAQLPKVPRVLKYAKDPRMQIRLLEDTQGTGRFDKSTVFADRLTYPEGVLWHEGAVYTAAPPNIWRLRDTQGKGQADERTPLVTGFTFDGAADDLHGPSLGPDGRIYWGCGHYAHNLPTAHGSIRGEGPRIYRCRPDGSDLEMVSAALGNPVEVAFTPEGEALACGTFITSYTHPFRDGIIHCVEGGVFPVLVFRTRERFHTGERLPPIIHLGHAAPSGMMRYRGNTLGSEYRDNFLMASFNLRSIQRHVIERDGATFTSRKEDLLVSPSSNFHPTDVLEDADGSLLVVDTGTWFDICPTAGLGKKPASGGIYRVRRKDAPRIADPWGLKITWDRLPPPELIPMLNDERWAVRDRAIRQLAKRGSSAVPALHDVLMSTAPVRSRRNAIWALNRIDSAEARRAVRRGLQDNEPSIRLTAATSAGLLRDGGARQRLEELVRSDTPPLRREAATALGRLGRVESVPSLFEGLRSGGDRFLEHALIYALIRIGDPPAVLRGLEDPSPLVRRGALIALDQMDNAPLTPRLVSPLLADQPVVQKTALAVVTSRGWGDEASGLLGTWLAEKEPGADRQEAVRGLVLGLCKAPAIQKQVTDALRRNTTPPATRLLLLETMARAPLDKLPAAWLAEFDRGLEHAEEAVVRQSVVAIRVRQLASFDEALLRIAHDETRSPDLRAAACAVAAPRLAGIDQSLFDFLLRRLDREVPPLTRLDVATALGAAVRDDHQREALGAVLPDQGALELPRLLRAFERCASESVGRKLLAALERSPGLASLSPEQLRRTLHDYPPAIKQLAEPLLKKISVDTEKIRARIDELEPVVANGDARRGREVFFGKKAVCSTCHTVQTDGARIGPDLTKIAAIRNRRDLLEAIVFPSGSFARGYETYVITTRDGKVYPPGILGRETAEAIHLITADRTEVRIPRSQIEGMEPSKVSIMPQGLDAQLSKQELGDLMAFLVSLK